MTAVVNPMNMVQSNTSVNNISDQLQFPGPDVSANSTPELGKQFINYLEQSDSFFQQSTVYASNNPPIPTSPVDVLQTQKTLSDMTISAQLASKVLGSVSQDINTLVVKMQ